MSNFDNLKRDIAKIHKQKVVLYVLVVLLIVITFVLLINIDSTQNKKNIINEIDKDLKTAVYATKTILGDKFFDKAVNKNAISDEENKKITLKLSNFVNHTDITYVYTMVIKNNKVYFTSSSATPKEIKNNDFTSYFEEYPEATKHLKNILKTKKAFFEESTDKWGTFRSYLAPFQTKNGTWYIVGADVRIGYIKNLLDSYNKRLVLIFIIFLILLFIIFAVYIWIGKKEKEEIIDLNKYLNEEVKEKTAELEELNKNLQIKIQEAVTKEKESLELIQSQSRLVQLGEMVSMIAHQWRQPLNVISTTAILVELEMSEECATKDILELISKIKSTTIHLSHLSKTIDDFRDFYKPTKEKRDITLNQLVDSSLEMIGNSIKLKNIEIKKELNSEIVFHTYANELKQVVLNLIKNAEDALLENKVENPYIKIVTKENQLIVSDNAGGIDESIIDKIFDPYFSTKSKNGTGLGLYMSKMIVEEHCGGKLEVKNSEKGAVFTIILN